MGADNVGFFLVHVNRSHLGVHLEHVFELVPTNEARGNQRVIRESRSETRECQKAGTEDNNERKQTGENKRSKDG